MTAKPRPDDSPTALHAWLDRHKIIFEIIVGSALVCASIIVSFLQWRTAHLQALLAKRQSEPTFSISTHQTKPNGEEKFTDEELYITNVGAMALEPRGKIRTWIEGSLIGKNEPVKKTLLVPLKGYYFASLISGGQVTGLLEKYSGGHNWQTWIDLDRAATKLAASKDYYLELRLRTYAEVSFKNILGEQQTKYYRVEPITGSVQISNEDGKRFVDDAFAPMNFVELGKLTPEDLFALAEKQQ